MCRDLRGGAVIMPVPLPRIQAQAGKMDVILEYLVAGALREMTLPTEWPKHNHMASHMWALCAPLAGCGAHGKLLSNRPLDWLRIGLLGV